MSDATALAPPEAPTMPPIKERREGFSSVGSFGLLIFLKR
jgi:hypothetical protein